MSQNSSTSSPLKEATKMSRMEKIVHSKEEKEKQQQERENVDEKKCFRWKLYLQGFPDQV